MPTTGEIAWARLDGVSPELVALAGRCLRADGGLPLADDPGFLRGRWAAAGAVAFALRGDEGALLAAGAARPAGDGAAFSGLVDPAVRRGGLGSALLDRGLEEAAQLAPPPRRTITVETETLSADADALFASRGLRRTFAEDVMRIDLAGTATSAGPARRSAAGAPVWPQGTALADWSRDTATRFHAVYTAAFRDRPGFPGTPAGEWITENEEDDDFRPGWSVLATVPGLGDAGFVLGAVNWIVQVGVVPAARGRGLGAALVREALSRMVTAGGAQAWLTVNVDNPGAAALYRRLGFADAGRRARYER